MRTCYMLQCYMRTCYSYSVTVLLNMLLGYCIYVYAYMLHTCECATERLGAMGLGPGGWGQKNRCRRRRRCRPPFPPLLGGYAHPHTLAAALHTINTQGSQL